MAVGRVPAIAKLHVVSGAIRKQFGLFLPSAAKSYMTSGSPESAFDPACLPSSLFDTAAAIALSEKKARRSTNAPGDLGDGPSGSSPKPYRVPFLRSMVQKRVLPAGMALPLTSTSASSRIASKDPVNETNWNACRTCRDGEAPESVAGSSNAARNLAYCAAANPLAENAVLPDARTTMSSEVTLTEYCPVVPDQSARAAAGASARTAQAASARSRGKPVR